MKRTFFILIIVISFTAPDTLFSSFSHDILGFLSVSSSSFVLSLSGIFRRENWSSNFLISFSSWLLGLASSGFFIAGEISSWRFSSLLLDFLFCYYCPFPRLSLTASSSSFLERKRSQPFLRCRGFFLFLGRIFVSHLKRCSTPLFVLVFLCKSTLECHSFLHDLFTLQRHLYVTSLQVSRPRKTSYQRVSFLEEFMRHVLSVTTTM
jgi:hypothetical protein